MDDRYTIGEVAAATGVTLRTLRFYEARGRFNLLLGCNTWTAAALRAASSRRALEPSPGSPVTRTDLPLPAAALARAPPIARRCTARSRSIPEYY